MPEPIKLEPDNLSQANWMQPGQHTMQVLSVQQIRAVETLAFKQMDSFLLMQAAGMRSANKIVDQIAHSAHLNPHFLVFAGPGNNGGDACIVAGTLKRSGFQVDLIQVTDGKTGSNDRQQAVLWALAQGIQTVEFSSLADLPAINASSIIVDGLLGIACDRAPTGAIKEVIQHINQARDEHPLRVYALDCPSGVNCDTGIAPGVAVQADVTFSYLACKKGLLTGEGKSLCGNLWIEALNCQELLEQLHTDNNQAVIKALSRADQMKRLPRRAHNHHKGSFGSLAIVGGQQGMTGACVLSARTALLMGCGRVALSLLAEADLHIPDVQPAAKAPFMDTLFPEIMNKGLEDNLAFADTVVIGPGLGQSDEALQTLTSLLAHNKGLNMVWDADALNLLAQQAELRAAYHDWRKRHPQPSIVFTPHPLEAARLLETGTEQIQADRQGSALAIAKSFNCTVVLKGSGSLICDGQRAEINLTGGPALGTAGSGDVLAGAIAALLGQGLSGFDAAALAVHLHGLAVEPMHHEKDWLMVSHASEIAQRMKTVLNHLLNQSTRRNG